MSSPYCCTEQAMKILNNPEQSEAMMMEEVRWQITSIFLVHLLVYVFKEIQFVNELYLSCQFLDQKRNAHVTVKISVDSFTQMSFSILATSRRLEISFLILII